MPFQDQTRRFLGSQGAATVVLMNSPDPATLPKKKEIRKTFSLKESKYLKGEGWYRSEIGSLERALAIANGRTDVPPWIAVATTDFLLLPPGSKQPLFFILKHAPVLIAGFDLTDACMADLDRHLNRHSYITSWRSSVEGFYHSLSRHSESAQEKGIADQSITNPDIARLQETLAGYGNAALASVTADIKQWCATYTWKA